MPRSRKPLNEQEVLRAAAEVKASVARKTQPRKQGTPSAKSGQLERLVKEVAECIETDDWGDKRPALLVGVFCWAHEQIYGVDCVREVKRFFLTASQGARKLIDEEFEGDFDEALRFMKWVWARERDREEWRRKNTGYGKRLRWRHFFVERELVTELRLAEARVGGVE